MKKKILNDVRSLVLIIIAIAFFTLLLTLSIRSTTNSSSIIILISIFGGALILGFVCFFMAFELICFSEDKVVSCKILKRVEILYDEIASIREVDKYGMGGGGVEATWEIMTSTQKAIYVIRSKRRKKIIEQIEEKITR